MARRMRVILMAAAGLAVVGALVWALMPQPVAADLVVARIAPMQVTVGAEGVTRVRDPWTVTAPVTGTTTRIPVHVGDPIIANDTVIAVIQPAAPAFLDARARAEAEAAVTEAEAALRLAEVNLGRAEADLAYADSQLARNRTLAERGTVPAQVLEDATQARATAEAAANAARYALELQRATLTRAQAVLTQPAEQGADTACCIEIRAPVSGTVLDIPDENARLVMAGSPIATIGDLGDLEIEVDLLSSDAVRVAPGAPARITRWGGAGALSAQVRRIDPAAFTRVSALGIEEQRVRLWLDLTAPPADRPGLGDRFRVFVDVEVWSDPAVLQVPQSALFRQGGDWALFRAVAGRAVLTPVEVGQIAGDSAQILSGLSEGDTVVAYPGATIEDGTRLTARAAP